MKKLFRISFVILFFFGFSVNAIHAQESDETLFYKYIALSAWNGVYYGLSADHIFEVQDEKAAAAIPIITAGTLALIPLFTNETRTITSNQLLLTGHGQLVGWAHGGSLALLINGDNSFDEGKSKLTVGLAALGSIGLGIAGRQLSAKKPWSEGQVALYRHYGLIGPITGFCTSMIFTDEVRVSAGSILLFGGASYLVADRVNRWHEFTRGEIRATQAITALNGGLGICVLADIEPDDINTAAWIIPILGITGGTALGHLLTKDLNLTPRQGMTTIYAAGMGTLIGVGLAILVRSEDSEFNAVDYLVPYAFGMGTFGLAVNKIKQKNAMQAYLPSKETGGTWDFSLMPQNLYINNKIINNSNLLNNRHIGLQPFFSASYTF